MMDTERRLGYRVPRSCLLPPYLAMNEYFVEYSDAIDQVFGTNVDDKIKVIQNIRNMWVTNPILEQKVISHEMIDLEDWTRPERELLVKQVNLLGMRLKSAGVLGDDDYLLISRFVGQYWFGKGTQAFVEFINFCLNIDLRVHRLWSEDQNDDQYHNLTRDEEGIPGLPIWEGGTWFPTAHVELEAVGGLGDLTDELLAEFFYEIANFNLVLNAVDSSFKLNIVGNPYRADTAIIAIGLLKDEVTVVSTEGRYGAPSPPTNIIDGFTVSQYGSSDTLIAAPSGWFLNNDGLSIMVFDQEDMIPQNLPAIPTVMLGEPADDQFPNDPIQYSVMSAPASWIKVPGSARSTARIPVWPSVQIATVQTSSPAIAVGRIVGYVANPKGWIQISPGNFTPYW